MRRRKSLPNRNPRDMKAAEESSFSVGHEVCFRGEEFFFLTERCGNVLENKGRLWKTRDEAGMYLKTDDANQSSTLFREVRKQQKSPLFRLDRKSASSEEEFLFLTERCGNIIENKGALLKTRGEAGMYKKTKEMRA